MDMSSLYNDSDFYVLVTFLINFVCDFTNSILSFSFLRFKSFI
jgi:hypothetical protein